MENNIKLEQNGRILPLWVQQNFKDYILPEIIIKGDPCNEQEKNELTTYQKFISQYLSFQSPFSELLIYHGVGAGKTVSAIHIYNLLFNYTPKINVFLLIPASLHDDPWLKDIRTWMTKDNYEKRLSNLIFIHYDSPFADRDFLEKVKKADSTKLSVFIIDECHRFINNVYNNLTKDGGKRAQIIYDYIQQEKKEKPNTKIVMLSATPVVNNPFEFALIFNLLRPDIFPKNESTFQQLFLSSSNFSSLNENTKNMFQRRILGLVSYYIGATPDKFAKRITHYEAITMEPYQEEIYTYYEVIEKAKEKAMFKANRGKVGDMLSTYSSYTRQSCNFVFPMINDKINGEKRPRPSHFNLKENDVVLEHSNQYTEKKMSKLKKKKEYKQYIETVKEFINEFINMMKEKLRHDIKNKHTLNDDINKYINEYKSNFNEFLKKSKKSKLFDLMYMCSPKFIHIIFKIIIMKGTVMVYSNYVSMEGLQLFKIYLQFFNFIDIMEDKEISTSNILKNSSLENQSVSKVVLDSKKLLKDNLRYCEFHGGIDKKLRAQNKNIFNLKENRYGKFIKIILISPAGAEGINLNNVRQVHIIEPYWNEARMDQVIGRALRFCQHKDLPMDERVVDIFRYKMIRSNNAETTDEKLESISRNKNNLLLSFIEAVKEASVDCELFKNHNMMGNKYKCFQFNQESYFEKPVGPAYNNNIEYDMKTDNGLNANDSIVKQIKTEKIRAVLLLDNNNYSEEKEYWFDDNTGIVYDYKNVYPIGKIIRNEDGYYPKLDNNIYIINEIIQIPEFRLYN
jgi:superfamily II DNA or RNA helicase